MGGEDTPFPHWAGLLDACEEFAALSGWRFILADFMRMEEADSSAGSPAQAAARARALPTALEYADRVAALVAMAPAEREASRLYAEFALCQRLVAKEAVHNSMVATCRALGLIPMAAKAVPSTAEPNPAHADAEKGARRPTAVGAERGADDADESAGCAYEDTSQPLVVIAARLANHAAVLAREPGAATQLRERVLRASFVTDFGLEHNLPDLRDQTCEAMLTEFLQRVKEWGGTDPHSRAIVRALVLEELGSDGDTTSRALARGRALRNAALCWFDENKHTALFGGAVLAGALGVFVAGAAILAAGAAKSKR